MIYYSNVPLTSIEKEYRINKLTKEILALLPHLASFKSLSARLNKYDPFRHICSVEDINTDLLARMVKFLVSNILPHTRWECTDAVIKYRSGPLLAKWFLIRPVFDFLAKSDFNNDKLEEKLHEFEIMKYDDPIKFNRKIIIEYTGYQRFITRMPCPRFIPGISKTDYHIFSDSQIHHDALWFMTYEFKQVLKLFKVVLLDTESNTDPDDPENWVKLAPEVSVARSYIMQYAYPNDEWLLSDNSIIITDPDCPSHMDKHEKYYKQKKEYRMWAMLLAYKYCVEKVPNKVKYKPVSGKYKNRNLCNAIVDQLYFKGGLYGIHKNQSFEKLIKKVLEPYFNRSPIPVRMDKDCYERIIGILLNDTDGYCDVLNMQWDYFESIIRDPSVSLKDLNSNDIGKAKVFILWLSIYDMVTRCQNDLMARHSVDRELACAVSPFFNNPNTRDLIRFTSRPNGIYDINKYPKIKKMMIKCINDTLSEMLPKETKKILNDDFNSFKNHIFDRKWFSTPLINPNYPTGDDIQTICDYSRRISLYMIWIYGGFISDASITCDIDGCPRPSVAPVFGRTLTDNF